MVIAFLIDTEKNVWALVQKLVWFQACFYAIRGRFKNIYSAALRKTKQEFWKENFIDKVPTI